MDCTKVIFHIKLAFVNIRAQPFVNIARIEKKSNSISDLVVNVKKTKNKTIILWNRSETE